MKYFQIRKRGFCRTINKAIGIQGQAPFSAKNVLVNLTPSKEGKIRFIYNSQSIIVSPAYIKMDSTSHTTILTNGKQEIIAVEHILSALYGLEIDSVVIELIGDNQVPVLDASAKEWTTLIRKCGFKKIKKKRRYLVITDRYYYKFEDSVINLSPGKKLQLHLAIKFDNLIGEQSLNLIVNKINYIRNICWGRTFIKSPLNGDIEKWPRIRKLLPILPEDPSRSPVVVFSERGYITKLKSDNEPAVHKAVDFLGDLALLGFRVEGLIKVYKPGHYFNHLFVRDVYKCLR